MDLESVLNEGGLTAGGLAKRNMVLAGQLATAQKENAELRKQLEELRKQDAERK